MEWKTTLELGYADAATPSSPDNSSQVCFGCGKAPSSADSKLLTCAKCHTARYCSKTCQVQDWKEGQHKLACASYQRVGGQNMTIATEADQAAARQEIFQRVRFYALPYAVHQAATLGRGFLFLQTECTLAGMSLTIPKDPLGRALSNRSLLVHYLTLGQYDAEVCREDFELALLRPTLVQAVESYDEQKQVVVLMRFRCGHCALGVTALVPDYKVCRKLGQDYFADSTAGALQLNLDDI